MKMSPQDFNALHAAIAARFTLTDYVAIHERYRERQLSDQRFRWDMLHASEFDTAKLYASGLSDAHIDTALRKIFDTLKAQEIAS